MNKVIVTGFTPFNGESLNPSYEAVKQLPDEICGWKIIKKEIPTLYRKAGECLISYVEEEKPSYVIMVGQAGGRNGITVEKYGLNVRSASVPDNDGVTAYNETIFEDGENAYVSTIDAAYLAENLRKRGINASVSFHAGTFVCNELLTTFLYHASKFNLPVKGTFIHVPYLPSQVVNKPGAPSMPLEDITASLKAAIETVISF